MDIMNIVVLTTNTLHHAYYINEIIKYFSNLSILVETKTIIPKFQVNHLFEKKRDEYEKQIWFQGKEVSIQDILPVFITDSINSTHALNHLIALKPDIIIVFGTGKILSEVIESFPGKIINLHGGDPELYRGLDSHLWSIYHNHFDALITTLHFVNQELDDGDIIMQMQIQLKRNMQLYQLRSANTEACVQLTLSALDMYQRHKIFLSKKQKSKGRYYSFMPDVLKNEVIYKFERYTEKIC